MGKPHFSGLPKIRFANLHVPHPKRCSPEAPFKADSESAKGSHICQLIKELGAVQSLSSGKNGKFDNVDKPTSGNLLERPLWLIKQFGKPKPPRVPMLNFNQIGDHLPT